MTTKFVVTDEQKNTFYNKNFDLEKRFRAGALDPDLVIPGLQLLVEGKATIADEKKAVIDWLTAILARERAYHLAFFGKEFYDANPALFDLAPFEAKLRELGPKTIKALKKVMLEPHFLPRVAMSADTDFPGWKIKPNQWFYTQIINGQLLRNRDGKLVVDREAHFLPGATVLVDVRPKPVYDNGKQMYDNDNLLGPVIWKLRVGKKIARYGDFGQHFYQNSRFGVSAGEWEAEIKKALTSFLTSQRFAGLKIKELILEPTILGNVIPQLYPDSPRQNDGKTDILEWREEYFEGQSKRLHGGSSDNGGLADVSWNSAGNHWHNQAIRPLAVLIA